MDDNGEKSVEQKKDIELKIILQPNGAVVVNGPIKNEMLSFWLLDKAKDAIKSLNAPVIQSSSNNSLRQFLRKRR